MASAKFRGWERGKERVENLQNVEPRKSGSSFPSRVVYPSWNRIWGRRKLVPGTEGVTGEAARTGRSCILISDCGGEINGALLLSSMQEEISKVRNLKNLSREVFCCVSEKSHGVGCSRLLPKVIMRKLGEKARHFSQQGHQYAIVCRQRLERFGLVGRWRWVGEAFTFPVLCSLEENCSRDELSWNWKDLCPNPKEDLVAERLWRVNTDRSTCWHEPAG